MTVLAKITAVIIIIAGLLVMLGGIVVGLTGAGMGMMQPFGGFQRGPMMPVIPQMMGVWVGLLLGGAVFIQGLMLAALGEALYLISNIAQGSSIRPV